jgi:hypothetical protein
MKLLDDLEFLTAKSLQEPHHFHKILDVAATI